MLHALLAAALAAADPEPSDVAAARLLVRATGAEPSIEAVQRAAAAAAARGPASFSTRARLAALVPKVATELRLDDRRYRVVGLTGTSEVDYVRHTPGTVWSVRLSWDLGDLVFAEPELRAAAQARDDAKARAEAVERATRLYYERQRLLLAVAAGPSSGPRDRAEQELALEELAARLDALTGGAFRGGAR